MFGVAELVCVLVDSVPRHLCPSMIYYTWFGATCSSVAVGCGKLGGRGVTGPWAGLDATDTTRSVAEKCWPVTARRDDERVTSLLR